MSGGVLVVVVLLVALLLLLVVARGVFAARNDADDPLDVTDVATVVVVVDEDTKFR